MNATWHVPPECAGQIVEVAYLQVDDGGILLRRTTDTSVDADDAARVTYHECWLDDAESDDIEPWNEEPSVRGPWMPVSGPRLDRLLERS